MARKMTYKKLQIYTEWLRFDYGIETFFEKEVMILLSWKQWTESNRENSVALFYCEGGYMCYNKTN